MLDAIGVLLVEDDDGDALLVEDFLEQGSPGVRLVRCRSVREAIGALGHDIACVLLDLGLPDVVGLDSLARMRAAAPELAVIVLTGLDDEAAGVAAVDAGAQDYLIKGKIDGGLLARSIRYAIGRRQAEEAQHRLRIAGVHADENARLQRGLMAAPIVQDPAIWLQSTYRAGRRRALLGGDFFDVVETDDGRLHALIGDVCGHGPDEAALGASLRIAWRALTLSGAAGDLVLQTLERVIQHERQIPGTFATLCSLEVDPSRGAALLRRAGHPFPVLIDGTTVTSFGRECTGPPIGTFAGAGWTAARTPLPADWSILLFTDGLIEGRVGDGPERLGQGALRHLISDYVGRHAHWRSEPQGLLDGVLARVTELHGEELSDDVAMLLIGASGRNGG